MAVKPDFGKIVSAINFAILRYLGWMLLLLGAGAVVAFGVVTGGADIYSAVGGTIIGAAGAAPMTKMIAHLGQQRGVTIASELWDSVHETPPPDPDHVTRLNELFWKMLEKEALG